MAFVLSAQPFYHGRYCCITCKISHAISSWNASTPLMHIHFNYLHFLLHCPIHCQMHTLILKTQLSTRINIHAHHYASYISSKKDIICPMPSLTQVCTAQCHDTYYDISMFHSLISEYTSIKQNGMKSTLDDKLIHEMCTPMLLALIKPFLFRSPDHARQGQHPRDNHVNKRCVFLSL